MYTKQNHDFTVVATDLGYPEGPVYLPDGRLAVVEVMGGNVVIFREAGGGVWTRDGTIATGGSPNGLALAPDGSLIVCNSGGFQFSHLPLSQGGMKWTLDIPTVAPQPFAGGMIQKVDLASNTISMLCASDSVAGPGLRGPDDLVFDNAGGLWFTDFGKQSSGLRDVTGVYYLAAGSTTPVLVIPNRISPNGIAISPAGDRLYVAETIARWVMSWALDPAKPGTIMPTAAPTLDHSIPLASLPEFGEPDSMALDVEGNLYVATTVTKGLNPMATGGITIISPQGLQLDYIPINTPIPDPLPSNVCFGGPDMKTAFITLGGTGRVVSCRMPVAGLKPQYFGGRQ